MNPRYCSRCGELFWVACYCVGSEEDKDDDEDEFALKPALRHTLGSHSI